MSISDYRTSTKMTVVSILQWYLICKLSLVCILSSHYSRYFLIGISACFILFLLLLLWATVLIWTLTLVESLSYLFQKQRGKWAIIEKPFASRLVSSFNGQNIHQWHCSVFQVIIIQKKSIKKKYQKKLKSQMNTKEHV